MKETEGSRLLRVIGPLFVLALIATSLLLYFEYQKAQNGIRMQFVEKRNEMANNGFSNLGQKVETDYSYLLVDCGDRGEYDKLIDRDSRELTATELKRALQLHSECGQFFANKSNLIVSLMEAEVNSLREHSELFGSGKNERNAEVVVGYWDDIFTLERERGIVYGRLVDIQKEYWESDLDKVLNIITSGEREAAVGALNFEANQKLSQTEELLEKIKESRKIEAIFWGESFGKSNSEIE